MTLQNGRKPLSNIKKSNITQHNSNNNNDYNNNSNYSINNNNSNNITIRLK